MRSGRTLLQRIAASRFLLLSLLVHAALGSMLIVNLQFPASRDEAPQMVDLIDVPDPETMTAVPDIDAARLELEQQRVDAERRAEAEQERLAEQERQRQAAEAERQRQAEEERQRQADVERQRQAEEERQRQAEAERQRQAEEERQRQAEAERQRQAEEERQRQFAEQTARAQARFVRLWRDRVLSGWRRPPNTPPGLSAVVRVRVDTDGQVRDVSIVQSSGNTGFDLSVQQAIRRASPLPVPDDASIFRQSGLDDIQFRFVDPDN